ncbi:MAG: 3-deoxy-D-manno-octulosonic acid transferase [Glycocaulis sp.]
MTSLPTGLRLYRSLSGLAAHAAPAALRERVRKGKEDPARLDERFGKASLARPDGALIWIHGASVGESRVSLALARALKADRPGLNILLTSGTLTSASLIAREGEGVVLHQFVPIDAPDAARRFAMHWKPDLAVFVESELWPNLIIETAEAGAKLALVNARMNTRSLNTWQQWKRSGAWLLNRFDWISPADACTAAGLSTITGRTLPVTGNLKLEAAPPQPSPDALSAARTIIGGRPVFVAASTHAGEEDVVLDALELLREDHPGSLLILVPRHPDRATEIGDLMRRRGTDFARRSLGQAPDMSTPVWLADTLGELSLWYTLAPVALIGGSLKPGIGGHNPVEASQAGCAVISGPYRDSFADVFAAYEAHDGVVTVEDAAELAEAVARSWQGKGPEAEAGLAAIRSLTGNAMAETAGRLLGLLAAAEDG